MRQKIKATPLMMLIIKDIDLLEHEPDAQYRFNRACLLFFLWQMPLMIVLILFFDKIWLAIGLAYCTEISLWSLVGTHLGNMISAISAHNAREANRNTAKSLIGVTDDVNGVSDDIDDIQDSVDKIAEAVS